MEHLKHIAKSLDQEIQWFEQVVDTALTLYFKNECDLSSIEEHHLPEIEIKDSSYLKLVDELELNFHERLVLITALIPHIKPNCLDIFLIKNQNLDAFYAEFGGRKNAEIAGFFPTLSTACFIIAGDSTEKRLNFVSHFHSGHRLFTRGVLELNSETEFGLNQELKISQEYLGLFLTGKAQLPQYSSKFPAKEISTDMGWEDLVIDQNLREDLAEVKDWLAHSDQILNEWKLSKNLRAGYRVLFYGPPGTGKTLAATLLGKETKRPVFRVDLSLVVSKYIGETEKNLGRLFDEAEHKQWILFFDEADALFGKRTQTKGANDRYANQEVAYLLQRIENFAGLVILATNIQTNIDEAFSRRFQSMVYFPKPGVEERKMLWKKLFEDQFELDEKIDSDQLAKDYELSGGEMINILRFCALEAAKRGEAKILLNDIIHAVKREYSKSNRTL